MVLVLTNFFHYDTVLAILGVEDYKERYCE